MESYPIPRVEELFTNLIGGKHFSKLDLAQAYLQLPLSERSRQYVTINTTKGLFQYNRLPFGVSSAPAIFQRCMETVLQGCLGTSIYMDDNLITGKREEEHLQHLDKVMAKLKESGFKCNKSKCFFMRPKIKYLGHIDAEGLHPTEEKVKANREAPKPKDVGELRSFLGILNYYGPFLCNLSTKLAPLYDLLRKGVEWIWTRKHDEAFNTAKSDSVLVYYDPDKPLVLICDTSPYGIGAVLSHTIEDGTDRPASYASRALTTAEKRYSQ